MEMISNWKETSRLPLVRPDFFEAGRLLHPLGESKNLADT